MGALVRPLKPFRGLASFLGTPESTAVAFKGPSWPSENLLSLDVPYRPSEALQGPLKSRLSNYMDPWGPHLGPRDPFGTLAAGSLGALLQHL